MAEKIQCGDWIKSGNLGCGSFGVVSLWENRVTARKIAVKECKNSKKMNDKSKIRWKQEVQFLKNIKHLNVIQAFPLPEGLKCILDRPDGLPALCMEYCEGGDLRKTLSTTEHCCGLKETMILKVCGDIAAAIQCLHKQEIAHRDLKPENIVIRPTNNGMICKVIDLGYAKQLNQTIGPHSVVGTQWYLAPEIMAGKEYSISVDYWSYGILIYECCTGNRPFPQDFFKWIAEKAPRHISVSLEDEQEDRPTFSESLPEVNRLNSVLKPKFEKLFRLLFELCPKKRGGMNEVGTRSWFECVQEILSTKIIEVFCIDLCTQYMYELSPNLSLSDLTNSIQKDTGISAEHLELFVADGSDLCSLSSLKPNMVVFVFNKAFEPEKKIKLCKQISSTVEEMLDDPDGFSNHVMKRHLQAWKHSVFYVQTKLHSNTCLKNGWGALMIRFLYNSWNSLNLKIANLRQTVTKLKLNIEFFKLSLDFDMEKYKTFCDSKCQESGKPFVESWKGMKSVLDENRVLDEADAIFEEMGLLQDAVNTMKKNCPQGRQGPSNLQLAVSRAKEVLAKYEQMKKMEQGKHSCWKEKICDLRNSMQRFKEDNKRITDEFYLFLRKLVDLRQRLKEFIPKFERCDQNAIELSNKVEQVSKWFTSNTMQQKRQEQLWMFLCAPVKEETDKQTPAEPKRLFNRSASRSIIQQSQALVARVKQTLQDVKEQQEMFQLESQGLDWTFCE